METATTWAPNSVEAADGADTDGAETLDDDAAAAERTTGPLRSGVGGLGHAVAGHPHWS